MPRPAGAPRHGVLSALRPHDALLALEDGTVFFGWSCGAPGEMSGELVFNTSMMGYPEIITDPSYRGQIVTFTYPLIGNYGMNAADAESPRPQLSGVVVRTMCGEPSSWRSKEALPDYLRRHRIVAIEGVDTRALTIRLRSAGVMRAVLSTRELDPEKLVAKARASQGLVGRDLVAEVTPFEASPWLAPVSPAGPDSFEREPVVEESVAAEEFALDRNAAADRSAAGKEFAAADREAAAALASTIAAADDVVTRRRAEVHARLAAESGAPPGSDDAATLAVEAAIEARRSGGPLVLPIIDVPLRRPRGDEATVAAAEAGPPPRAAANGPTPGSAPAWVPPGVDVVATPAPPPHPPAPAGEPPRIAVLHCGMKANIAEELRRRGAEVRLYPARTPISVILADRPDGLVLSNGPGDPEGVDGVVEEVRAALGKVPIFGICLGIQMLALALGARTYKLKFGHRGGNQPVLDLATGRVEITSQNHGFAVDPASLETLDADDPRRGVRITHVNLNDGTVEGFEHAGLDVAAVQYHPEAAPGPRDAAYHFDRFLDRVRERRARRPSPLLGGG
jgi:carbamoylphosphate synthase small subunit